MSNWLKIDVESLNQPREGKVKGMAVRVYFSPYDVPRAVRGEYDAENKQLVLRFHYFEKPEATREIEQDNDIVLRVGNESDRLQEIRIDVKLPRAGASEESSAIEQLANTLKSLAETSSEGQENLLAASGALEQQKTQLESELTFTD